MIYLGLRWLWFKVRGREFECRACLDTRGQLDTFGQYHACRFCGGTR